MSESRQYSEAVLESMQSLYGKGFLSPGGAAEVFDIVDGIALAGREVLDLGCGVGGATVLLAGELGAARVLGVDVEAAPIDRATALAEELGLSERVRLRRIDPGPLPLPDGGFDVVFTKDVVCHVPDKPGLFAEVHRVLRPGGVFVCADWVIGAEGPGREAYEAWAARLAESGLVFHFAPLPVYTDGLEAAGFADVEVRDHSAWSARDAERQLEQALGPESDAIRARLGEAGLEARLALTRARRDALDQGSLLHLHLRARKPA